MQEKLRQDILNEYNQGLGVGQIARKLGITERTVLKVVGNGVNGVLDVKLDRNLKGIYPEELEAFKKTLQVGQEIFYRPLGEFNKKPIYAKIKAIYPNFIYSEDDKSLYFSEVMVATGWLSRYRSKLGFE